jgi:hypothetical protein
MGNSLPDGRGPIHCARFAIYCLCYMFFHFITPVMMVNKGE